MKNKLILTGKRILKYLDSFIDWLVLLLMLLLLLFGGFVLWDTNQMYETASSSQYVQYKPTSENEMSIDDIQDLNSDVFAWLTIYGTHVDYPVVKGITNDTYINTDVFGKYSLSGSIFIDCKNSLNFEDFNSIIYGHHMEKQAMFGELDTYSDESVFREKCYGNMFFSGKDHGLEIFAYVEADAYDKTLYSPALVDAGDKQEYLDYIDEIAIYKRDVDVTIDDKIVLLSTCSASDTNGRHILVAKITDKTFEDLLSVGDAGSILRIDPKSMVALFGVTPDWVWLLILFLLIMLYSFLSYRRYKRRRKS